MMELSNTISKRLQNLPFFGWQNGRQNAHPRNRCCFEFNRYEIDHYALISRVRGPHEEISVLMFKACGSNAVRNTHEP